MAKKQKDEKLQNSGLTIINNPLDIGKGNIIDLLNKNDLLLLNVNFINPISIPYDAEYNLPKETKFLLDFKNCIYAITNNYKTSSLKLKKITNFIVKNVKEVVKYENKLLGKTKLYSISCKR